MKSIVLISITCLSIFYSCKEIQVNDSEIKAQIEKDSIQIDEPNLYKIEDEKYISYIKSAPKIVPHKNNRLPFSLMDYDKIIAYDFEDSKNERPTIFNFKTNEFTKNILNQRFLTQDQADRLLSHLSDSSTYGMGKAACFTPHFGLLFIKDNIIIDKIDICISCNYLEASFEIPGENHKVYKYDDGNKLILNGFTEFGHKGIVEILNELQFNYDKENIFY